MTRNTSQTTRQRAGAKNREKGASLFSVPTQVLQPALSGPFSIYLEQGGKMVLYAAKGEIVTEAHSERLASMGVERLHVRGCERSVYNAYVRENISIFLEDETIPCQVRAELFCEATTAAAREAFDRSLPNPGGAVRFQRIQSLLRDSMSFFIQPEAIREIARLVSESSDLYEHGVGVMVLTTSLLNASGMKGRELLGACSVGALLHDMGKLELPQEIFERHPDTLEDDERRLLHSHPALGVSVCSMLPLPQEALHCILFHHELENGRGYPSQARGDMLPYYARVLALCNVYDGFVRIRPWRKALTPFEAMVRIKGMRGAFDEGLVQLLDKVLVKAGLT